MTNFKKIAISIKAIFITFVPPIPPSIAMDSEAVDYSPKSEQCRQVLASMLIDKDFMRDVSNKVLTIKYAFRSHDINPLPEISWMIAKMYYHLQTDEKIRTTSYVIGNKDLIKAIDDKKKFIVVDIEKIFIGLNGYKNLVLALEKNEIPIEEIFILQFNTKIMDSEVIASIKYILNNFPIKTIKLDSRISWEALSFHCLSNANYEYAGNFEIPDRISEVNIQNLLYTKLSIKPLA